MRSTSRHRRTTMNPPVKVDSGGQPRSRGSKRKGAPEQWRKERREMGVVTLADTHIRSDGGISRARPKHTRQASSRPASREKWKLRRRRCAGWRGGRGMRPSRQKVRGGKPNTTLERGHPGKPWEDGPFRVTNQSLSKLIAEVKRGERRSGL
jgi:hypothetical protein